MIGRVKIDKRFDQKNMLIKDYVTNAQVAIHEIARKVRASKPTHRLDPSNNNITLEKKRAWQCAWGQISRSS